MLRSLVGSEMCIRDRHTNDAPGAITRLIDMGVEPFLISSTLEAVLGQRLLRSICNHCRAPFRPNDALLAELGVSRGDIGEKQFFYGKGCDTCNTVSYTHLTLPTSDLV